jgi:hypothetical protein
MAVEVAIALPDICLSSWAFLDKPRLCHAIRQGTLLGGRLSPQATIKVDGAPQHWQREPRRNKKKGQTFSVRNGGEPFSNSHRISRQSGWPSTPAQVVPS